MTLMPEDSEKDQEAMKSASLNSLVVVVSKILGSVESPTGVATRRIR
jgi:hypothetical protein